MTPTQPIAPGMADEIAREMKGLRKKDLVNGIKMNRSMIAGGRDRMGLFAESLGNLEAEYRRRYGKDLD
jgi:hypothetical protein